VDDAARAVTQAKAERDQIVREAVRDAKAIGLRKKEIADAAGLSAGRVTQLLTPMQALPPSQVRQSGHQADEDHDHASD
jgi:cyanate lyase